MFLTFVGAMSHTYSILLETVYLQVLRVARPALTNVPNILRLDPMPGEVVVRLRVRGWGGRSLTGHSLLTLRSLFCLSLPTHLTYGTEAFRSPWCT